MSRGPVTALCCALSLATIALPTPALAQQPASSIDLEAVVGTPAGAPIAGEELDRRTVALGSTMRCPVCQGLSIADSPSSNAVAMLTQVRDLLAAGYSEQQILDYFVGSYGEFVLLQPKARGFNLVVWLAPLVVVLAGLGVVARRGIAKSRADAGTPTDDLSEYLERVRSEVRR